MMMIDDDDEVPDQSRGHGCRCVCGQKGRIIAAPGLERRLTISSLRLDTESPGRRVFMIFLL